MDGHTYVSYTPLEDANHVSSKRKLGLLPVKAANGNSHTTKTLSSSDNNYAYEYEDWITYTDEYDHSALTKDDNKHSTMPLMTPAMLGAKSFTTGGGGGHTQHQNPATTMHAPLSMIMSPNMATAMRVSASNHVESIMRVYPADGLTSVIPTIPNLRKRRAIHSRSKVKVLDGPPNHTTEVGFRKGA
jgi:hypothetical protein